MKKNTRIRRSKKAINEDLNKNAEAFCKLVGHSRHFKTTPTMNKYLGSGAAMLLWLLNWKMGYWAKDNRLASSGTFYLRQKEIEKELQTSRRNIPNWIKTLETVKFDGEPLLIVFRQGKRNRNDYRISVKALKGLMKLIEENDRLKSKRKEKV